MSTTIASLFAANANKQVVHTGKMGESISYVIHKLSDKTGVMKNGNKDNYIILARKDDMTIVVNLHPQVAHKLLSKGEVDQFKIVEEQTVEKLFAEAVQSEDAPLKVNEKLVEDADVKFETAHPNDKVSTIEHTVVQIENQQQADVVEAQPTNMLTAQPMVLLTFNPSPVVNSADEVTTEEKPKMSKKARTLEIYQQGMKAKLARKDIIKQLREELSMSAPGASTYYQNCKSGLWA